MLSARNRLPWEESRFELNRDGTVLPIEDQDGEEVSKLAKYTNTTTQEEIVSSRPRNRKNATKIGEFL
jgi:hypothetical protein